MSQLYSLAKAIDNQFDSQFVGLCPNTAQMIEASKDNITMALYQKPDNEAKCAKNQTAVKSILCYINKYAETLLGSIECGLNDDPKIGAPLGNSLANAALMKCGNISQSLSKNCKQKTTLGDVKTCVLNTVSRKHLIT